MSDAHTTELTIKVTLDAEASERLSAMIAQAIRNAVESVQPVPRPAASAATAAPPNPKMLLDVREVARLMGVSQRTVSRFSSDGTLPKPIRIGAAVRWSADDLRSWIAKKGR